jgi:hypothetical protein
MLKLLPAAALAAASVAGLMIHPAWVLALAPVIAGASSLWSG